MQLLLKSAVSLVVFLVLGPIQAFALDQNLDSLSENQLRTALQEITSRRHHSLGYDRARIEMMGNIDLETVNGAYVIHDVYCQQDYGRNRFPGGDGPGPGQVPDAKILNTEHTWPQSHFGGKDRDMQKADLHHLFPSDSQLNAIRGNNPFGDVVRDTQNLKCQGSHAGVNKGGRFVFEPPRVHQGNVARALFYFAVRYQLQIDPVQEQVLRAWHESDPVDQDEITRNDKIEALQENRNPFIDKPEFVGRISDF